jgi:hypothetical protein
MLHYLLLLKINLSLITNRTNLLNQQTFDEHLFVQAFMYDTRAYSSLKYQTFNSKISCFWGVVSYSLVEV